MRLPRMARAVVGLVVIAVMVMLLLMFAHRVTLDREPILKTLYSKILIGMNLEEATSILGDPGSDYWHKPAQYEGDSLVNLARYGQNPRFWVGADGTIALELDESNVVVSKRFIPSLEVPEPTWLDRLRQWLRL